MYRYLASNYEEYLEKSYENETTCELVNDLEKIDKQRKQLDKEELYIIKELWKRIPSLKKKSCFSQK